MTTEIMEVLAFELQNLGYTVNDTDIETHPPTIDVTRNGVTVLVAATDDGVELITEEFTLEEFFEVDLNAPDSLTKLFGEIERITSA